jgi:hypothetical protein
MAGVVWFAYRGRIGAVPIGQVRVWLPDGRTRIVPLLEQPRRGANLSPLGIVANAWVVVDLRVSDETDLLYDVWVEAA